MARRLIAIPLLTALLLTACTDPGSEESDDGTPSAEQSWPAPSEDRPVVNLAFTLPDTLDSATGTETVTFTPDQQICELVFRAWPNRPGTAEAGNELTVNSLKVGGRSLAVSTEPAGAPDGRPGTLVTAALPACSPAGRPVTAHLEFDVRLGEEADGSVGWSREAQMAWLGGAFPLLAWERGRGWAREPAVPVYGETATSETFRLNRLEVTVPSDARVAGVGEAGPTRPGRESGTTVHTFSAPALRDVSVTVGEIDLTTFETSGTSVVLALPTVGHEGTVEEWRREISDGLAGLTDMFGPVPYPDLWLSVIPTVSDGVEYPGAIQFGDVEPDDESWLVLHELAHLWFYGLVGNNTARDPWLDESFATYAQELVEPTRLTHDPDEWLGLPGAVGDSMQEWARRDRPDRAYVATVYRGGGRALIEAREADGDPEAFDQAVRAYLRAGAGRIATPADVRAAFADLSGATRVLREAGALP